MQFMNDKEFISLADDSKTTREELLEAACKLSLMVFTGYADTHLEEAIAENMYYNYITGI